MKRSKNRAHLVAPLVASAGAVIEELIGGGFRWGPKGGEIVFPGHPGPQAVVIGEWSGREKLVEEIGKTFFKLGRTLRKQTRQSHINEIVLFLKWLAKWDAAVAVKSSADISPSVIQGYLKWLRKSPIADRTRHTRWRTLRVLVLDVASTSAGDLAASGLQLPVNPFPFWTRSHESTEPLSIEEVNSLLGVCLKRMEASWNRYMDGAKPYRGPAVRDLFPFLYVAGLLTTMNPDTLRQLKLHSIQDGLDGRIVIRGDKFRAGRCQKATLPASEESPLDGKVLFSRVIRMTAPLRAEAEEACSQDLWLARRERVRHSSKSQVISLAGLRSSVLLLRSKDLGCAAGVPNLSLKRMRATGAELLRILDMGVPVATILGNSSAVAERHYRSAGARKRERVALARQMEVRMRYVRTKGARDVRDRHGAAQSAATPGFSCTNPFAPPPELGQAPGMCAAFLACPGCPQSGINVDSPETAADLLSVRAVLEEARKSLPPMRWREVYSTAYAQIGSALSRMNKQALSEGAALPLRTLPELE